MGSSAGVNTRTTFTMKMGLVKGIEMHPSRQASQMQASPVMNLSLANVRRVVLGSATSKKLGYSAQPSLSVKGSVNSLPCDRP